MPQLIDNKDGTFTQVNDNGTRVPVMDPTGDYRRTLANAAGAAITGAGAIIPGAGLVAPIVGAAVGANGAQPTPAPSPVAGSAPPPGPITPPPPLPDPAVLPNSTAPAVQTETHTTHSASTSGPDAASRGRIETAGKDLIGAENKAADTGMAAGGEMAQHHAGEAVNQYMLGKAKEAGAMQAQQTFSTAYDAALKDREQAQKRPIDLKEAFGDDRGAYAFLATMGAAIANVGRAWMGQAMQPITVIDDLINRSIKLQMDRRSQDIQAAGERADVANQRLQIARADAHEGAAQAAEGRMQFAKSQDEMSALAKIRDDQRAKAQAINFDIAKATATQAVTQSSTVTESKTLPGSGGPQLALPQTKETQQGVLDSKLVADTLARDPQLAALKPEERQAKWEAFHKGARATADLKAATQSALAALEAAHTVGEDVEGQGMIAGHLPDTMTTTKANALRQSLREIVQAAPGARDQSRAPSDAEQHALELLLKGGSNYSGLRRGIEMMAQQADRREAELKEQNANLYQLSNYIGRKQHDRGQSQANEAAQLAAKQQQ